MTDTAKEGSIVLWQQNPDGVGEPALLIEGYSDVIQIGQEGNAISINYENVDEICKALKQLKRNRV